MHFATLCDELYYVMSMRNILRLFMRNMNSTHHFAFAFENQTVLVIVVLVDRVQFILGRQVAQEINSSAKQLMVAC